MEYDQLEYLRLSQTMGRLCKVYSSGMETDARERRGEIQRELRQYYENIKGTVSVGCPELLLALMDSYEVTRDEDMLQEVLDVVSENLERLEVSAENVKLFSYCYYYVEDEECAIRARQMLTLLKEKGEDEEIGDAEQVYWELVEENN